MACFLRADHGVSTIEFALLAPVMFVILLGSIELGLDMMVDATVQYAAQEASRAGITTTAPADGNTRGQEAQMIAMQYLQAWANIGAVVAINEVDYGTYGSSTTTSGPGGLGDVVSYNVSVTLNNGFTGIPTLLNVTPLVFQRNYLVQNEK
jgi:Flp pilus assembly protein TadG